MKFTAFDVETANRSDESICAIGLAVFEDGQLAESKYWLVRPPKGAGWFIDEFIAIHGITHVTVRDVPEFPAIAPELFARLAVADIVIAHKADFDMRLLRGTARHFGLTPPEFDYLCTLQLARRVWPQLPDHQLSTLAARIGHNFKHHHAGEDAEAAGRILLAMMKEKNVAGPRALGGTRSLST